MNPGTASLSGSTIVGSDAALIIATALAAALEASAAAALVAAALPGVSTTLPSSSVIAIRQSACDIANGVSTMIAYITTNAVVPVDAPTEAQILAGTPVNLAVT